MPSSLQQQADKDTEPLLTVAETYLREIVAPQAQIIDRQPVALQKALQGLGDRNLLALQVPQKWGGAAMSRLDYRHFQISIARYSGALALLQTQHQSAAAFLAKSDNQWLQAKYLPGMGGGKVLVGVGFSQLRRQGPPVMQATPTTSGYLLSGKVPWITGWGYFGDFIIGAMLPDGSAVYGMVPLQTSQQSGGGQIAFSSPLDLAVMSVTNTVSATLQNWFLASDRVITIKPPGFIVEKDEKNVLTHGFFALGCAWAAIDIIQQVWAEKQLAFLQQIWQSLTQEVNNCQQAMLEATASEEQSFSQKLQLRAQSINLANKCSQAAVVACSGAANYISHPAQRVYREALMFSVFGQTTAVMEATLQQLLSCDS